MHIYIYMYPFQTKQKHNKTNMDDKDWQRHVKVSRCERCNAFCLLRESRLVVAIYRMRQGTPGRCYAK